MSTLFRLYKALPSATPRKVTALRPLFLAPMCLVRRQMSSSLSHESKCVPCEGIGAPLTPAEAESKHALVPLWELNDGRTRMSREVDTANFLSAIDAIKRIAPIAENEGHHPDLHLTDYKKLKVELWTHALGGLTDNDFIMAIKIDTILDRLEAENDDTQSLINAQALLS
eukprot:CAMPEP_0185834132 /NCGR_PEP_ID=MMETSP1353-20130828/4473_1 /TAXON_ID=1077150 /ORGANISM="Erythrolobus australicus, Strain CCMP3124" /LENGTH=169 /DNA_ID=CAMNT_0028532509 /DNA_START=88 /DNA_END=595 /DNA_ORIENTATION=+